MSNYVTPFEMESKGTRCGGKPDDVTAVVAIVRPCKEGEGMACDTSEDYLNSRFVTRPQLELS
jgi:hypothetical protein